MASFAYDQMDVGDTAEFTKTLTEADVCLFGGITGDMNPIHVNAEYAKGTMFGSRLVHGALVAGLISTVLGNLLPGHGTIFVSQAVRFLAPVRTGDTVTARVEIAEKLPEKKRILLKTVCLNQDGVAVIEGEALVSAPRRQGPVKQ